MDKTLEQMTDETIFISMLEERPALVGAIAELVAEGQSPVDIEHKMRQAFGNIQMVRNVYHVANYLVLNVGGGQRRATRVAPDESQEAANNQKTQT